MEEYNALNSLSALAQETRLAAFRLLVEHEPDGLSAGRIADALGAANNTLSSHLSILAHAGLVEQERRGRQIVYRAVPEAIESLVVYLLQNCCGGHPEVCASLAPLDRKRC